MSSWSGLESAGASPLSGCCNKDETSSTARPPAIIDRPGLDTVHCWSRVRSIVESVGAIQHHYKSILRSRDVVKQKT